MNKKNSVAIVGAGVSGLAACKHLLERGFEPAVFEAGDNIGGVWTQTLESTKLQSSRMAYMFSDFPWPADVVEVYPDHRQVIKYLRAYAERFGISKCIKFRSKVVGIEFVGASEEEMMKWDLWGGSGEAFGGQGKWRLHVQHEGTSAVMIYEMDFVILCVGRFSGVPNVPTFPENEGPEVFQGRVVHSMDYSIMGHKNAVDLVKGKRVTVVGSQKSAIDVTAECASINGADYPCTMIIRTPRWLISHVSVWGVQLGYLYFSRFSELLFHKPGEGFLAGLVATLLSPLRWAVDKFTESYYRRTLPLRKYRMVPEDRFSHALASCTIGMLTDKFFDKVEEGSIVLKRSKTFSFFKNGVALDGAEAVEADVVIFATGYRGDLKFKDLMLLPRDKKLISPLPNSTLPFYRGIIHPRIPQLAVIGYSESVSNLYTSELMSKWLAHFLDGRFRLPKIRAMEENVQEWEKYMKQYTGVRLRSSCIGPFHTWYNDQLCKDIGWEPKRKKGFFAEWFVPYGPTDYCEL